jgi:hypothetical protein
MQPEMEVDVGNELPSLFPEKDTDLFPNPWPYRSLTSGSHKTPERGSDQWKALMKFKNSDDWKHGDLQKFAKYFGVAPHALSSKIKDSLKRFPPQRSDEVVSSRGEPR